MRAALALVLVLAGCAASSDEARPTKASASPGVVSVPITNTDACATRLHDISGKLIVFRAFNGRLPASLEEFAEAAESLPPPGPLPELACPVSGKAYVYRRDEVFLQDRETYVVLHDAEPSHGGMRWATTWSDNAGGESKVIPLPESFFVLNPPR